MTSSYMPSKEEVAAFYDNAIPMINRVVGGNVHVGYWTSAEDRSSIQKATDRLTDMVVERLAVTPGQRVLDVGCGLGGPAIRLAKAADVRVVGIATSPKLVAAATDAACNAEMADQVTFEVLDAEDLTYADSSFDAVMAIESLVHMTDKRRVFRNVSRVLRPGGMFVLTDRVEKTSPTEKEREIIESYRRFAMQSPIMRLDEYMRSLIEARLLPMEYQDITAATLRHHIHMMEAIDQHSAELSKLFDPEMLSRCKSVLTDCFGAGLPTNMLLAAKLAEPRE
jgi:cyclopropane fatty-acyl-phospholipid synthase-like methyltransferase